ncbi:hypothetical protein SAMN00120144_1171 [Hymenobacter roseosalivarius DSM 11622]|uniref:Uncharacterized protein n=2 Tax=Hymenobacter roseosalivarius TaxID=89967 RepID=A0A1W1V4H3_9BACT|nr:hypothetical protein SAMN00120144_1171 [Hymenobacter roseosalivarius DSM 11622]
MPSPTDPKIKPIGTIDQSPPPTQQPTQERVRKRQTVMDGKASPGVENTDKQRSRRTKAKKPRPARAPESTGPPQ